jgi:hypothetical protein
MRSSTAIEIALLGELDKLSDILGGGLIDMAKWGYTSGAMLIVKSVPSTVWAFRLSRPREKTKTAVESALQERRIFPGPQVILDLEFGTPSTDFVRRILRVGSSGVDAMSRIKTVAAGDLHELRRRIVLGMSATSLGDDDASAVESLAVSIRQLVGNDPSKSTGMNYRAKRIARTEGIRIAEESQREAWRQSQDLFDGMWTERGGHADCDICDKYDHVLYLKDEAGRYISDNGDLLPDFPTHPNCMCFTVPEIKAELTDGLPAADYGDWYSASLKRSQSELANA